MPRVSKGAARTQARKRILREARGYYGARGRHKWKARLAIRRAGVYAYRDRRRLKREMRALWIIRLTAACRMRGMRYSVFMHGLRGTGILLNRKMLSELAICDPATFDEIVDRAKKAAAEFDRTAPSAALPDGDIELIQGVGKEFGDKLRGIGLGKIKDYLLASRTKAGRGDIAGKTGISEKLVLKWANHADLFRIKGVAGQYAELLEASGVDTVKELAKRIPANLAKKVAEVNKEKNLANRTPGEPETSEWVAQAKRLPGMLEY